jgi:hypothetical protein
MTDTSNEVASAKKARLVENFYIGKDGQRQARPMLDVVSFGKKFLSNGHEIVKHLSDFSNETLAQAAAFGLQQVGQNAYGGVTDDDEKIEALEARWDNIQAGQWSADRQVGPRSNDLVEAFAQVKIDEGKNVTDEWKDVVRQKLESGELQAKDLAANPRVKAKIDAIKAARAAERAKKSAAAAGSASDDTLPDIEI